MLPKATSGFFYGQNSSFGKAHNYPDFIKYADKYNLDYRLLVSISGVESTFAKNYIPETFNAYGWGGGEIVDRGAINIEEIGRIYCPPNSAHWASSVRYFMAEIDNTNVIADLPLTL